MSKEESLEDMSNPEVVVHNDENETSAKDNETPPRAERPQPNKSKKLLLIIGVALLVIGGAAYAMLAGSSDGDTPSDETQGESETTDEEADNPGTDDETDDTDDTDEDTEDSSEEETEKIVSSNFKEIPAIKVFSDASLKKYYQTNAYSSYVNPSNNLKWFEMGTIDGERVLLLTMRAEGLDTYVIPLVFVGEDTNLTLLAKHSAEVYPKTLSNVKIDDTRTLSVFSTPDEITVKNAATQYVSGWGVPDDIWDENASGKRLDGFTKIESTPNGVMYEKITDGSGSNVVKSYQLALEMPFGTYATYRFVVSDLKEDQSMAVTFNSGDTTNYTYRWDTVRFGCGSSSQVNVLSKAFHKDLVATGSANGQTVYEFQAFTHKAVSAFYESYTVGRKKTISQKEYFNQHNLIAMKNELGYYVLLGNSEFQPNAECAKPVIYLYPETATLINVKVGADVTLSDPYYNPDSGWNVVAHPNGKMLSLHGWVESLFWDGSGHGEYPAITSGTVVKTSTVEQTIRANLATLGLNQKETNDFLDYWMPLMPETEYVRLTWITTEAMNRLAPLELSVTPDTMIRVFLDYEGLDAPIAIPKQKLPTYQRSGFTLVEWGGLKIGD